MATHRESFNMAVIMEDEVTRLQRQYRLMRSVYTIHVDVEKKSTRKGLLKQKLSAEHAQVSTELKIAVTGANRKIDSAWIDQIKTLLLQHNGFESGLMNGKNTIAELEMQIRLVKKEIINIKMQSSNTDTKHHQRVVLGQTNFIKMENKLELYMHIFCSIQFENKKLRYEIHHLIKERELFNTDFQRFFTRLSASKQYMHDLIEQVIYVYNERDDYCQKVNMMKAKARADIVFYSELMQSLQFTLDRRHSLQRFLEKKALRRTNNQSIKRAAQKLEGHLITFKNTRTQYAHFLEEIKELVESDNVHDIIRQYITNEEENFLTLEYMAYTAKEMDTFCNSIERCRILIDEERRLQRDRDRGQQETLLDLTLQLEKYTAEADQVEKEVTNVNFKLDVIFYGIARLFNIIGGDFTNLAAYLGMQVSAGEDNIEPQAPGMSPDEYAVSFLKSAQRSYTGLMTLEDIRHSTVSTNTYGDMLGRARIRTASFAVRRNKDGNENDIEMRKTFEALNIRQQSKFTAILFQNTRTNASSRKQRPDTTRASLKPKNKSTDMDIMMNSIIDQKLINIYNVFLFLGVMESKVLELLKRGLWLQEKTNCRQQYVRATTNPEINTHAKVQDILTPCPICFENSQVHTLTDYVVEVMSRTEAENKMKDVCQYNLISSGSLVATNLMRHNVSDCTLPGAHKIIAKRFE